MILFMLFLQFVFLVAVAKLFIIFRVSLQKPHAKEAAGF